MGGYGWTFGIFSVSMVVMLVLLAFLKSSYRDARVAKAVGEPISPQAVA